MTPTKNYTSPNEYPEEKLPVKKAHAPPFQALAERVSKNPERLAKVLEMIAQEYYSRGLRDMDQMHNEIDNLTNCQ